MGKNTIDIKTSAIFKTIIIGLGFWFLFLISDIIALFFIAVIVMAAMEPAVNKLQSKRIPRSISVLLIYLSLFSGLAAILYFLIPALGNQLQRLSQELPSILEGLMDSLGGLREFINTQDVNLTIQELVRSISSSRIFSTTIGFFSGFLSFIVILSMAFYMSISEDGMEKFLRSIIPTGYKKYAVDVGSKIKNKIGKWMLGQFSLMFVIFLLDLTVLLILDVPYALTLAIIGGLLEIVPYLGPTVSAILASIVGFIVSPVKGILVLLSYVIIQVAENNIIAPQIMKKAVGLNPLAVILALLIGAKIAGVLGAILAVPVATVIGVFVEDLLSKKDVKKEIKEKAIK